MLNEIRQSLLNFINSDKDTPLLAGFSVGFYMILFYYSKNYGLANSPEQLLFFIAYYIALPVICIYFIYRVLPILKLKNYRKNFLFISVIGFFSFYLLQVNTISFSKHIAFGSILIIAGVLSLLISKYYKLFILLLLLLSIFNIPGIISKSWLLLSTSDKWKKHPDDIENVIFKERPNIYYIQPDGYTNFKNLKDDSHNFDNNDYEKFLIQNGFTLYSDYRSNYYSTLLSNSATFSMMHHYLQDDIELRARNIIMSDNPVLGILQKNDYKTHFITENPYLIINRPDFKYDYKNIQYSDIPYLKDGFGIVKDVMKDFKTHMSKDKSGNFYFIEKFSPGHICVYQSDSKGVKQEKEAYLERIKQANIWLKDIVSYITASDSNALIIIGADHGGFAGFENTLQSTAKTNNKELVNSIFGAQLAIKWTSESSTSYDKNLKTGVNLFRTIFSFLAHEKKYLLQQQEDVSYIKLENPKGIYKYINSRGEIVFEKQ